MERRDSVFLRPDSAKKLPGLRPFVASGPLESASNISLSTRVLSRMMRIERTVRILDRKATRACVYCDGQAQS